MAEASALLRWRKWIILVVILSVLTAVGVGLWAQYKDDTNLLVSLRNMDPWWIAAAIGLHVAAHSAWAVRIMLVGRAVGARIPFTRSWQAVTAGVFAGAVTPARVGGEGLRFALLSSRQAKPGEAGKVVLADRSLDLVFFVFSGMASVAALPDLVHDDHPALRGVAMAGVAVFVAVLALLVLLLVAPRLAGSCARAARRKAAGMGRTGERVWLLIEGTARHLRSGLIELLRAPIVFLLCAIILTVTMWGCDFAILWAVMHGLHIDAPFWPVLLGAAVLSMVTSVPITPGAAGIAELGAIVLFSQIVNGLDTAFVLVWRAVTFDYDLLVGGYVAAHSAATWSKPSPERTATPSDPTQP